MFRSLFYVHDFIGCDIFVCKRFGIKQLVYQNFTKTYHFIQQIIIYVSQPLFKPKRSWTHLGVEYVADMVLTHKYTKQFMHLIHFSHFFFYWFTFEFVNSRHTSKDPISIQTLTLLCYFTQMKTISAIIAPCKSIHGAFLSLVSFQQMSYFISMLCYNQYN